MIFPIGDENIKGKTKPYLAYSLIVLNILIFVIMKLQVSNLMDFYEDFATIPTEILLGNLWYTLATNMFLHADFMHLFGNMLFLWIFADNLEVTLGHILFIVFYLLGGVIATLIFVYFNQTSELPTLGASGAMSAVMGAYLIFFPYSKIKTILLIFFVKIPAITFMIIWFIYQLFFSILELGKDQSEGGTAWMAHIGGFIFGMIFAFVIKRMGLFDSEYQNIKKA